MGLTHWSLDELDTQGIELALSDEQSRLLRESSLVDVLPLGGGRCRLLPNGRVGAVRFADLQVEVTPKEKLGLSHLLFMLGYANDPGFRPETVHGEAYDELWPAMAHSLSTSVERALRQGLLQGYRSEQDALFTVRGRIAFEDQLRRRPGRAVPIEVRYDEFTTDIAENQILLAALHIMLGVPRLRSDVRRGLLHLTHRLSEVTRLTPGRSLPPWQPTRLNERYHSALGLAEIILSHCSTRTTASGVDMSSFVVVMWKVFEDFVTAALEDALAGQPGSLVPQLSAYLTGDGGWAAGSTGREADDLHGDVAMNVDVVHLDNRGIPRVVFDAKYKLASRLGDNANADHYQMLAYTTALEVPVAWLIYAGGGQNIRRRIKNTEIDVVVAPVDLRQSPEQLLARVREIAFSAIQTVALG